MVPAQKSCEVCQHQKKNFEKSTRNTQVSKNARFCLYSLYQSNQASLINRLYTVTEMVPIL